MTETEKELDYSITAKESISKMFSKARNTLNSCEYEKECIHWTICRDLHDTYKAKNADYGDSFAQVREKYPNAILIRLNDKLSRLETLMNGAQQHVNDESVDDTLLDLANYCIMELVERRHNDGIIRDSEISE